jgi:rSAM/selenodomain-associated transferase 2
MSRSRVPNMSSQTSISVIIPCWNDEPLLESLLGTLNRLAIKSRYDLQLIVVDGACSNRCMLVCQRENAQWLQAMPCRGEQLRRGAAHARHPVLWFLHADAQLRGNPLELVSAATARGAVGGYFAFRFANTQCWQSRLLEALIGIRNRVGTPYGDQGIFVTAEAYESCGQHSPWPLFEEIELIKRLRRYGPFECVGDGVEVDPRRWQQDGWWSRSFQNRVLALAHVMGVPATRLAELYRARKAAKNTPGL